MKLKNVIKKQSVHKTPKTKGFVLYEGKSNLDPSQDIVAIVTTKTTNKKTCHVFFEIDYRDDKMIAKILKDNDFSVLAIENDLSNRPRCIVAKMN